MERVLLINPPSSLSVYSTSKIRAGIARIPLLSLAILATPLIKLGYEVEILNLAISLNPTLEFWEKLRQFDPHYAGITFSTPLYSEAVQLSRWVKQFNPEITIIGGGVHSTCLPEEVLNNSDIDIVVIGEGDLTIVDLFSNLDNLDKVRGIYFKKGKEIIQTDPRPLMNSLDNLPYPSWHLYELNKYRTPRLTSRNNPVGPFESSRGCPFECIYCNKNIFSRRIRYKSPERVVKEIEFMLEMGFREIHIWEDNFSTNLERAKKICNLIIQKKLKFSWNIFAGLRVNSVDKEFLTLAKEAGCYGIGLAPESGNQGLLDRIKKNITLEQCRYAFKIATEVGLEVTGFFMFGLPGETEETMGQTINFALELDPTYAKVTILVPFPSTEIFQEWNNQGIIKSKDWSKYNFHTASKVYNHPNLSWNILEKYYDLFYRKFYFRPGYILNRIRRGLINGNVFYDIYYFLKTWLPMPR